MASITAPRRSLKPGTIFEQREDDLHPLTENPRLTRAELERLVWSKTPADYRSTTGGTRKVLTLTAQGTMLVPLSELTDWQLRQLLGKPALTAAGDFAANARRGAADEDHARELCLYIENDSKLVGPNSQGKAIEQNLLLKVQRGTFDKDRSVAAWMYLMETGAKAYAKEFGDSPSEWSVLFNPATRELAANYFAEKFADELPYRSNTRWRKGQRVSGSAAPGSEGYCEGRIASVDSEWKALEIDWDSGETTVESMRDIRIIRES